MRTRLAYALHSLYVCEDSVGGQGVPPYFALAGGKVVDNPDQRVVGDVRDFSSALFEILAGRDGSGGMLEAVGSIAWYTLKTADRTGWVGVVTAYGWSIAVATITVAVINATAPWVFRQEELEAKLRYGHVALRRCAEEIAFLRGGPAERANLDRALSSAVTNAWAVIQRHVYLNMVQYGFGYFVSLVMYAAIGLSVFSNVTASSSSSFSSEMTAGEKAKWISQTGGVFIQLLYSFTTIIQLGTATTTFVTNTARVAQLIDALHDHDERQQQELRNRAGNHAGIVECDEEPLIAHRLVSKPSIAISADEIVLKDLVVCVEQAATVGPVSISVAAGQWVLLDGPSGSGKTTILRTMRGLHLPTRGSINMPLEQVMFAPQRVYLAESATLRELVLYPNLPTNSSIETDNVVGALRRAGWRQRVSPAILDAAHVPWAAQVSPGEAQMIAAARLLAQRPRFAVLDEPTSALDAETERILLDSLREAGIGVLTAGHKDSIRRHHDLTFTLGTSYHNPSRASDVGVGDRTTASQRGTG
jgi:ABC-type uncharacterized transport system fused permease/ATPase subunit